MIELADNTAYLRHDGLEATIQGPAAEPAFVWSLQGDWYERATGRYAFCDRDTGGTYVVAGHRYNIEKVAP